MREKLLFLSLLSTVMSLHTANAFKLPDTGQTICYQASSPYLVMPCAGTGQDGAYIINPMSYKDNGNGTVTDDNTGLMWQQQDDEKTYNWYQATGTYSETYNSDSQNVCRSLQLGGYIDWRLPSKKELQSIIDYSIPSPGPMINQMFFPNTQKYNYYLTSTADSDVGYSDYAWAVGFGWGDVYSMDKGNDANYVKCVRGSQTVQHLINNGNGTVTDTSTGLIWQQFDSNENMSWEDSLTYCNSQSIDGNTGWRLPNIRELASLIDDSLFNPAVNNSFFNVHGSNWSSTTNTSDPSSAWDVWTFKGIIVGVVKGLDFVRCVHGGESGSILTARIAGTSKYFSSIQKAQDEANDENTIEAEAGDFQESLNISNQLTFIGGFDSSYSSNIGLTYVGGIIISEGSLTVENIVIM
jgi:hypothetical protein